MSEKSFYEDGELKLSKEEQLEYLKEQEIDRISNGECPKISYDFWLTRLTSEQREVEKENQKQFDIWLKERTIQLEKQAKQDEEDELRAEEDELRALKYEKMGEAMAIVTSYIKNPKRNEQ